MNRAFAGVEVRERQLGVDDVDVVSRIHFVVNVDNVVILEAAHNVADRFGFTNVGQELVTQAFTFGCAFYQARDVHEFHGGWQNALRFHDFRELVQTRVRHWYNAGVRFDGTEREVRRFDTRFGKRVKQGGFAHVWQTDDTAFESHF
ncbi:Uncharacterised protein [Enterobacter hormaechei]|nr:Uncharacterised protein [Enterobacter hormaechei]SAD61643.1 Uncharacterised protein [Enterobacter hormaechei]